MKKIILYILFLMTSATMFAQEFHFSQRWSAPQLLNPALSGFHRSKYRATLNYKRQNGIAGTSKSFNTMAASFDMPAFGYAIENGFGGLGISIFRDNAGRAGLTTNKIDFSPALHLKLDKENYISMGLQGTFLERKFNPADLTFGNQFDGITYDQTLQTGESTLFNSNFIIGDFAIGMQWNNSYKKRDKLLRYSTGLALFHILAPKESFINNDEKIKPKLIYNAHAEYDINYRYALISTLVFMRQAKYNEIDFGLYGKYKYSTELAFSLGGMIRSLNMLTLQAMMHYHHFDFGISYDYGLKRVNGVNRSLSSITPEISIIYYYGQNPDVVGTHWAPPDSKFRHHMKHRNGKMHKAKF